MRLTSKSELAEKRYFQLLPSSPAIDHRTGQIDLREKLAVEADGTNGFALVIACNMHWNYRGINGRMDNLGHRTKLDSQIFSIQYTN